MKRNICLHENFEQWRQLNVLLVPGGKGARKKVENSVLINFISERAKQCEVVLSLGGSTLRSTG